jgi:prophage maintenance system killer protein
MDKDSQLIKYVSKDGSANIEVSLVNETVWLSLNDMVDLFERDKSVISRHINNVYKEGELDKESTVANIATVQREGEREISRDIAYYNLDVIISIGYRVKSNRGTNFRIWATQVLKKHIINNAKKTSDAVTIEEKYLRLIKTIQIAANAVNQDEINEGEAKGILKILQEYAYALETLDKYDHKKLTVSATPKQVLHKVDYEEAKKIINDWQIKEKIGELFGREKDDSFKGSLNSIYQTFEGKDVYPGIEEKAANLLYFIVKNHSFADGNKRIAAVLFVYFLDKNETLYKPDGSRIIGDNALVAITIMIAESNSEEKDTMVKLVVNLINSNN